jgi:hypothetical protein
MNKDKTVMEALAGPPGGFARGRRLEGRAVVFERRARRAVVTPGGCQLLI